MLNLRNILLDATKISLFHFLANIPGNMEDMRICGTGATMAQMNRCWKNIAKYIFV